jgi:hydrogenase maturation protease
MGSTLVIGFGNTLRGDDGVGILAVRSLREQGRFGPGVCFLEMEAALVNLLDHLDGVDRLLVVDSIQTPGGTPGQSRRMTLEDLVAAKGEAVSTHQIGLARVLDLAGRLGLMETRQVDICAFEIAPPPDFSDHPTDATLRDLPAFLSLISSTIREASAGGSAHGND